MVEYLVGFLNPGVPRLVPQNVHLSVGLQLGIPSTKFGLRPLPLGFKRSVDE